MIKGNKLLTLTDRRMIEHFLSKGLSVSDIASIIGKHRSTIYREIKRGLYEHRNSDWTVNMKYSADKAQAKINESLSRRGAQLKIGHDFELAGFLEKMVVNHGYSPAAALAEIKRNGLEFRTSICVTTFYSYIGKGVFLYLSNKDLPVKCNRKRKYNKVNRHHKRPPAGDSIERRPEEIKSRAVFGHWEMDSVVSGKNAKATLLVFTERMTRHEIIALLPDHTAASVVTAIDALERHFGRDVFRKVFRTITVDNGTEFSNSYGLQRSVFDPDAERTHVFYCHPYSSFERGSNENANKLIRRMIPKGANIGKQTDESIRRLADWINNYPRKILGWRTSNELFKEELAKLGIAA